MVRREYMAEKKPDQIELNNCDQLKLIAARVALNYDCNIKIEISVDKDSGSIIVDVKKHNVKNL